LVGEVGAERAATGVGRLGVDALAALAEDAHVVGRQPGPLALEDLVGVTGVDELDERTRKDQVDLGGHAASVRGCRDGLYRWAMRLGVLDIGSNTGHLLVFDAHDGAAPLPAYSHKEPLRLAEHLDAVGDVTEKGRDALTDFVASSVVVAEDKGCEEGVGFATSAVRDAGNSQYVLDHVHDQTGVRIDVLSGEDEARLTFLAVRRWFGWSAGRLSVCDIGGGSLEIAGGSDESPDVAWSVPLGAARLARKYFAKGRPDEADLKQLRRKIRAEIARDAGQLLRAGRPDKAAATSKTFRSLARICGAAPAGEGALVPRT